MSKLIRGIIVSDGVTIARAYLLVESDLTFDRSEKVIDVEGEVTKLNSTIGASKIELTKIRNNAEAQLGADKAAIFDAHLSVLDDPELIQPIQDKIKNENVNAATALTDVTTQFVTIFEPVDNKYMRERAADIRSVSKRVLSRILDIELPNPSMIDEDAIIVGNDLTPSDTAQLNKELIQGLATNVDGRTDHSAIVSRSLEIPAIVGTESITQEVKQGNMIIVDRLNGDVIVNPTEDKLVAYQDKRERYFAGRKELQELRNADTVTVDGAHTGLAASTDMPNDLPGAIENGVQGIGLYRTELLYMGCGQMPTEEEQFEAYEEVLEAMSDKCTVVHTLDIGGDKGLSYLGLPEEMDPFLSCHTIRLCLAQQNIFRPQLRTLLHASVYDKLNIMFPVVAAINEFREAKAILLEEEENLKNEGHDISDDIGLRIVVEISTAAALADVFAKEVDFFSIGANDLTRCILAADRMSEHVSYLYQPYNPSILRLVRRVIGTSHKEGKWTGMCDEMTGDGTAIPLLLSLGLDEFSMSVTPTLKARRQVNGLSKNGMTELANRAVNCTTQEEIIELVNNYVK